MRHIRTTLALFALALAAAPAARAQQAPAAGQQPLTVTATNRTAAAEAERGAPRRDDAARPGDVIRYRLTFRNPGSGRVRGVVLNNPVAAGMRFVGGSAQSSREDIAAEYSTDGGRTWSAQPMEEVTDENGRRVRRPAAPETYTHVRWTVQGWVNPGATVTAEFDARLEGGRSSAPAPGH
jgi:uncharacterized repeat protein (TIGR01451 family)